MSSDDEEPTVPEARVAGTVPCPECGGDGFLVIAPLAPDDSSPEVVGEVCPECAGSERVPFDAWAAWRSRNPDRRPKG